MENPFDTGTAPAFDPSLPPSTVQWADFIYTPSPVRQCAHCQARATWSLLHATDHASDQLTCNTHKPTDTSEYVVVQELTNYDLGGYKPEAIARWKAAAITPQGAEMSAP